MCPLPRSAENSPPSALLSSKPVVGSGLRGLGSSSFVTSKMSFPWAFLVHEKESREKKAAETEVRVFTNNQIPMILRPYTVGARRSLKDQLAKPSGFEVEESETRKD